MSGSLAYAVCDKGSGGSGARLYTEPRQMLCTVELLGRQYPPRTEWRAGMSAFPTATPRAANFSAMSTLAIFSLEEKLCNSLSIAHV